MNSWNKKQILIRKRAVPSGNKAVRQQKLQSSRWNKRPLRVPFSTAPQWRSVEPSSESVYKTTALRTWEKHSFPQKAWRVDSIHFTMSSSTKTTQPRDPAKSSHFRRKMAQHKRPTKASRCGQHNFRILLIEHTRARKRARHFVHGSGRPSMDRKNRNLEVQLCRWQAQKGPWA